MKFQKLLVNAAAIGLLAGASGTATAVDCSGGVIQDTIVESVEVSGRPCVIIGTRIIGGVRVDSSPAILMVENDVGDGILVRDSGTVAVVNNRVTNLSLVVNTSDLVAVKDNRVKAGSIRVNLNVEAVVTRNDAQRDIVCRENTTLDAFLNHADDGEDTCEDGLF